MNIPKGTKLALALLFFLIALRGARAQDDNNWTRTAQVQEQIPMDASHPLRRFLDTLTVQMAEADSLTARHSRSQEIERSLSELKQSAEERGFSISPESVNLVRIRYRFQVTDRRFEREIKSIQYLHKSPDSDNDITPAFYIDCRKTWVKKILNYYISKRPLRTEVSYKKYLDRMSFAYTVNKGKLLKISGEDAKYISPKRKKKFIEKIMRLTYKSI
jgi:hypothetical protein